MDKNTFDTYYNLLSTIILIEGFYMAYLIYVEGYIPKVFLTMLFMILGKISQINLIEYYKIKK